MRLFCPQNIRFREEVMTKSWIYLAVVCAGLATAPAAQACTITNATTGDDIETGGERKCENKVVGVEIKLPDNVPDNTPEVLPPKH
jgi:hypothetical protein